MRRAATLLTAVAVGVAAAAAALGALSVVAPHAGWTGPGAGGSAPALEGGARPEPLERLLYLAALLLLPASLLGGHALARRLFSGESGERRAAALERLARRGLGPLLAVSTAGVAAGLALVGGAAPAWPVLAAWPIVAAAAGAALMAPRARLRRLAPAAQRAVPAALVGAVLVGVLLAGVMDLRHFTDRGAYTHSFNAVFHSVVQVHLGREMLVDLVNQYGLYPHFLQPLFALTGLSVPIFTLAMGALSALAFWFLYRFLVPASGSRAAALLGFMAVAASMVPVCEEPYDPFFQFLPIRFVFPAASFWLAWAWCRRPRAALAASMCLLTSAAVLWNLDTGLVLLGAWLALYAAEAALGRRYAAALARVALGTASLAAVAGAFATVMFALHGRWPDFALLLMYPAAFYGKGLSMLPMPPFGTWIALALVYAVGLAVGIAAVVERRRSPRALMALYLAVVGCGIFAYYQGRSAPGNLLAVSYPAIALCTMGAGALVRRARAGERGLRAALAVVAAAGGLTLATVAVTGPCLLGLTYRRLTGSFDAPEYVAQNVGFLRERLRPGEQVLILSYHSGVYHLATRTTTPLPLPGPTEIVRQQDADLISSYLGEEARKVVVDSNCTTDASLSDLARRYTSLSLSPTGSVVVLER